MEKSETSPTLARKLSVGVELNNVINVKFFRGRDEFISPDSLRNQFIASRERSRKAMNSGEKSEVPKCRRTEKLDLRKIVADIG